jgi:uncharacterized protein (TIGR02145 family)
MRKSILIALLVTLGLSFNACGGGSDEAPVAEDTVAPVFSAVTTASVDENQLSAITLSASDITSVTYSISEGDASYFDVDATSGVVTFKVAPDFEDTLHGVEYTFTATATDTSGNSSTESITITLLDINITHNGFDYEKVVSPYTDNIWLDRNLGASQVCTALDDSACYGDYYQWGRATDGHENNTSSNTLDRALAIKLDVGHSDFIVNSSSPYDWTADSLDDNGSLRAANWSKTDGSSVCPVGYRVPTIQELRDETLDNNATPVANNTDAFNNFLKFPSAGYHYDGDGSLYSQGSTGNVWSSSVTGDKSYSLYFNSSNAFRGISSRANGLSVRCLKD